MKKLLCLTLTLVLVASVLVACKTPESQYPTIQDIFNDFSSTTPYSTAVETLRLPSGVTVSSYDGTNDVYVTAQTTSLGSLERTRYGFCSDTEVLVEPKYTAVLDIRGDYAICLRTTLIDNEETNYVGLVKFRGEGGAKEFGFLYQHAPLITQFSFLNDRYVCIMGDKNSGDLTAGGYSYATVYDYSSTDDLLELGVINNIENTSQFVCGDDYVAVCSTETVSLYDLTQINDEGYFIRQHVVSLLKSGDGYATSYLTNEAFYVGGGWFIITATYSSPEEYDTYEIPLFDEDDSTTYYTLIKSVRISMKSGKQFPSERVTMVSNKYTDGTVRSLCDAINAENKSAAATWERMYQTPAVPTSAIVKDGYSILYYYYYYYTSENSRSWAHSFMIIDSDGNITAPTNLNLPVVYVDGKGLQNIDPNFKIPMRDVGYHTYADGTRKTLIPLDEDYYAFENVFLHNDVIISYQERALESGHKVAYLGATGTDGTRITDYIYDAFSPFFGEYAIAAELGNMTTEGTVESQRFYRISLSGEKTLIMDCYQMFNGVYSTFDSDGKFGLKSNDGTVLIPNKCELVSCTDYFFKDGKVFTTKVATVENGGGVIYALS